MNLLGKFEGLIFDFNGVLFWDDTIQNASWRTFASRLREKPLTNEEIELHVKGRNGKYTLEYLLGKEISQKEAEKFTEQKESIYRQMCLDLGDRFKLAPGAADLLETLQIHKVPFTIATASGKKNVDFFFRNLALDTWFELKTIAYDNGKIPGKPAPDLYLLAAKKLGVKPKACVVIEDSRSGIQAARNAGIGYIIAFGPRENHNVLTRLEGVNQILEALAEVQVKTLFLEI